MKRSVKRAKAIVSLTVAVGMCAITVNSAVIVTPAQEISINQYKSIDDINLSDFSEWKSGDYLYYSGAYSANASRICLNDYAACMAGNIYTVHISNRKLNVLIREMDSSNNIVKSWNLIEGQKISISSKTVKLAVSIYCPSNEKLDYASYKKMFDEGLKIQFEPQNGLQSANEKLENVNLSDINNWVSGCYSWDDGNFMDYPHRIALNGYKSFSSGKYKITITNSDYRLSIREKDASGKYINSVILKNGDIYVPSANAVDLGLTLYKTGNENAITYDTYKNMFKDGFAVSATKVAEDNTNTSGGNTSNGSAAAQPGEDNKNNTGNEDKNQTGTEDKNNTGNDNLQNNSQNGSQANNEIIENVNLSDINNWISGCYSWNDGKFMNYPQRIALNGYKLFSGKKYRITITNPSYQLTIREKDASGKFINSTVLKNGDVYVPSASAVALGLTLYKTGNESAVTYDTYKNMFKDGFTVSVTNINEYDSSGDKTDTPSDSENKNDNIGGNGSSNSGNNSSNSGNNSSDSVSKEYTNYKDELRDMLESGDMSVHDISKYNLTYQQMDAIYRDLAKGECYLAAQCYNGAFLKTEMANGKVKTVYLYGADKDFPDRYARTKAEIKNAISRVKPEMSDIEKVLTLHDYIVERTTYKAGYGCYYAGNPLAYGWGICSGYSKALQVLLREVGIESYYVSSNQLNHAWIIVKLDGEYYHIDPTWDDTRSKKNGQTGHDYFIRNDHEFRYNAGYRHYDWYSDELNREWGITGRNNTYSTSTKYTNWFVHDITGKILYDNGYWYYAENNSIVKSKIDGSCKSTVVSCDNAAELKALENGVISYMDGNVEKTYKIR